MSSNLFHLGGRVALVTGASGGLGSAISHALAAHGAKVIVSDADADRCEDLATTLRAETFEAKALPWDLKERHTIAPMASAASGIWGRVDVLVSNAGITGPVGPSGSAQSGQWDELMAINLYSALELTSSLVPAMADAGWGCVILMSSIAGVRGNGSIGAYGVSKAALAQLARNLAVEWGPRGVRACSISPGLIRTPFSSGLMSNEAFMKRRLAATPLRRVGEPHEIAGAVVFLASPAGAFVTGQNLIVDGGTVISDGS